ncbi:hypothetical protein [Nonomuraea sp. LPB2021202275-12-8]
MFGQMMDPDLPNQMYAELVRIGGRNALPTALPTAPPGSGRRPGA